MANLSSHIHYPTETDAHSKMIDVKSKIIAVFSVVLACSLIIDFYQLFWFYILLVFFGIFLRPRKSFLKYSLIPLPIIGSLALLSFLTFSSSPITYKSLFYETTHNNLSFALFFGFRSLLLVLFLLILINSEESFFEIIYGLDDLKMPDLLSNLTFLTYRFFFLMQEEFGRILEARSNRIYGEKLRINLRSMKVLGNIIGSALARSFKRAEYISAALSARGFSGKISHPEQPWTYQGVIFLLFTLFFVFLILLLGQTSPIVFLEGML